MKLNKVFYLIALFSLYGCQFSFIPKGAVGDEKTIRIYQYENNSGQGPSSMQVTFTEGTKDYFQQNTKLDMIDADADIELKCKIKSYIIRPVSAQANEVAAFNRLTITVSVEYKNHLRKEKSFTKPFSFFQDFPTSQNISSVEQDLIDEISDQIIRDIFNSSVGEW